MTYRQLPSDPVGYAVDKVTGTVHTRYAPHAVGFARTRSATGVWAILGRDPVPCETCYGPGVPVRHFTADDLELLPPAPEPKKRRHRKMPEVQGS